MVNDINKDTVDFHVSELKKLSYDFYRQLAAGKEPLTYGYGKGNSKGMAEVISDMVDDLLEVTVGFDTGGGLRFGVVGKCITKFNLNATNAGTLSHEIDTVDFHVSELKKLSYDFYRQLAAGKEPLTYSYVSSSGGQVELAAKIVDDSVQICIDFDEELGTTQKDAANRSFSCTYMINSSGQWLEQ